MRRSIAVASFKEQAMSRASLSAALVLVLLPVAFAWAGFGDGLFGDDTTPEEPTLEFTSTASHTTITPDTPLLIGITTTIPEGYHLLDQIDLTLDEGAPFKLGRWWHTPLSTRTIAGTQYREYVGEFVVIYELIPNGSTEPGLHEVGLVFEYSPCHEDLCFGLRDVRATIPVTVGDTAVGNAAFEPLRRQMASLTLVEAPEGAGSTEAKPAVTNKKYITQYNLTGRPNILFLDAQGKELGRIVGYRGQRAFLDKVRKVTEGQVEQQRRRSLPLWLGLALVGGLLAAFSPCVYPMIPITVGYLANQAGHQFRRNLVLVAALGIGVLLPFALIGAFIGALKNTLYSLTSNAIYVIALDVILVALTASMLGAFEIQLPAALRNTAAAGRNTVGVIGAFIIGLVVVPLAFACTAPALGVIIPFIIGQSLGAAMLIMVIFGLGLALPFLVAGGFTGAISAMPRAGAWMLGIKKVLALLLVGVIFYISRPLTMAFPDSAGVLAGAVFVAIAVGLGVFKKRVGSVFNRAVAVIALVLGISFMVGTVRIETGRTKAFPLSGVVRYPYVGEAAFTWRHDLGEALAEAERDHKLVMVYFWGNNCVACTEYQAYVWAKRETAEALRGFVPVKINVDE
jgi:thiol:disulfide interchange protein DsbD